MPSERPSIGISTESRRETGWQAFAEAVSAAAGEPMLLSSDEGAAPLSGGLQGIIFTGGGDLHPSFYEEAERVTPRRLSLRRDEFELCLCRQALSQDLPLLGVCRGLQVLVVAAAGRLYQHIPDDFPGGIGHDSLSPGKDPGHLIEIQPGSLLARLLGAGPCFVNTSHHQAARVLAGGLAACAFTSDGLIEAVEQPARRFALGVQWHPEHMWDSCPVQKRLIEGIVNAARAGKSA